MTAAPTNYPVVIEVEPDLGPRNRLTVAFRIILIIPHVILVGFPVFSFPFVSNPDQLFSLGSSGVIGAVAWACAIISWFAILFASKHPKGLWDLGAFFLRWWARAAAYATLLRDEYPPFGDSGDYAARFSTEFPDDATRNKLSVGLRFIYAIPHIIVLFFLGIAWAVVTIIAWFAILFTGKYPAGMAEFSVGVFRWQGRVYAYGLLMRDEYPPFSLQP